MPNLRVIHDNAADRATIVASSTAGALGAANLQTDVKSQVHRSVGTSVSYTLTWPSVETLGGVALPACNLTAGAQWRLRAYDAPVGGTLQADTGYVYACPGAGIELWDWSLPLNANAFAFGGATKCSLWLGQHVLAQRLVLDINDPGNPAGCIDCARLVCGLYWEPTRNARYGVSNDLVDLTAFTRAQSGDLQRDRRPQYDTMQLDLARMPPADRTRIKHIIRSASGGRFVYLSLLPESSNSALEQDMQIFGKQATRGLSFDAMAAHSTTLTLEGW